jgi:tagatose 6-phosphate kinase
MILIICLNPALQHTLWFENCITGEVNRAVKKILSTGGKGVNVARIIGELGEEAVLLTVLGGKQGELAKKLLQKDQISYHAVPVGCETRNCITIIDLKTNKQTELVEEGGQVGPSEIKATIQAFKKFIKKSCFLVVSGTAMDGFPRTIYQEFVRLAKKNGVSALIDASDDLLTNALYERPFLIKPNWKEMEILAGRKINSIKSMKRSIKQIKGEGAGSILVTRGSGDALLFHKEKFYRIAFPQIQVLNSIGSGDGVAAGIGVGMIQDLSMIESVRLGIACGTANCKTPIAGTVCPEEVRRIVTKVRIEPI